jgi:hypothetical protein
MKLKFASLLLAAGTFAAAVTTVNAANTTDPAYLAACDTLYYAEIAYLNAKKSATDGTAIQHADSAVGDAGKALAGFNPVGPVVYHGSVIYNKNADGTFGYQIYK